MRASSPKIAAAVAVLLGLLLSILVPFVAILAIFGGAVGYVALALAPTRHRCDVDPLPPGAPSVTAVERCDIGCTVTVSVQQGDWSEAVVLGEDTLCGDLTVRWTGEAIEVSKPGEQEIIPVPAAH